MSILVGLIVAAIAGFIAGKLMHYEKSIWINIVLGLLGGVVGNVVLGILGLSGSGIIGSIIVSVIGACIVIWLARIINSK